MPKSSVLIPGSLAELQTLCSSCGLPKSGTKAVLSRRLRDAARQFQPVPPSARILSIDLGLRNFAFSLLTPAPPPARAPPTPTPSSPLTLPVHLHAWQRLDLTSPTLFTTTAATNLIEPAQQDAISGKDGPPASATTMIREEEEEEAPAFSPSPQELAALTARLVRTALLPLAPTHVLIERQRYRTGGGPAVLEWTLRVNALEAMLHAAFATLGELAGPPAAAAGHEERRRRRRRRVMVVDSVVPRAVAGFLFPAAVAGGDGEGEDADGEGMEPGAGRKRKGRNAWYMKRKKEKVDLLRGWLDDRDGLVAPQTPEAREIVSAFVHVLEGRLEAGKKAQRKGKQTAKVERAIVTKLDDLSDSLLQGMVWLQWQKNLEEMIKARPELLEDGEVG